MPDAERIDEAVECDRPPRVNGLEQLAHAHPPEAVDIFELRHRFLLPPLQREDVGRGTDLHRRIFGAEEEIDLLGSKTLDVIGIARNEMLEVLDRLRLADEAAGAAGHAVELAGLLVLLTHGMAAADRAFIRERIGFGVFGTFFQHHVENLRDDVTGTLHDHSVADAEIMAFVADRLAIVAEPDDVIGIVQRGIGHHHAANGNRCETGDRRQRAGATDLDVDILDGGESLLGGKLVGGGPARAT